MKKWMYCLFVSMWAALALNAQAATEAKNFVEVYKNSCSFLTTQAYGDDWCNVGNAAGKAPNVVLIGDSYSNSLNGMMEAYAGSQQALVYEQYGRGQCPALLGYGPDWCANFADMVYQRIKRSPGIKTVLIAANWDYYWAEKKKFSATSRDYLRAEFEQSLQATLKAYQALGRNVVLIYQSPGLGDPKVCVQRRIQLGDAEDKCRLSRTQAQAREAYRQFVTPLLQQLKIASLDPYVYFCSATECQVKEGDKVFNTTTHLSGFGGQYLARKAAPDLKKLLQY